MKAIVYEKYGTPDVLHLAEVDKPRPKKDEILIKIYATTITAGDVRMRSFDVPLWQWFPARVYLGIRKPKRQILGMELAGKIEEVGEEVGLYKKGDQVFASTTSHNFGAYAEYKCLPEEGMVAPKPKNISYNEAAAVPVGGATALRFIKKENIQKGQKWVIYGASGSVGSYAVQLAQYFGAEVTGICSTSNLGWVKNLGAEKVIDYTQGDFTKNLKNCDVIFDTVGRISSSQVKKALSTNGIFLSVLKSAGNEKKEDLLYLKNLIEREKIRPVIDREYTMEEIPEAHKYVEKGHKKGNVVITIANEM
ncbi:MAG: Zn-dependent oxidoreductase, NADPH:quinone reductase [Promethearchaeota archaeon]|nr:MAG: Zn-dependent oxidoreductase, NADPH:quinone reductase [Candidatus Lokiarchaeota archaeon]